MPGCYPWDMRHSEPEYDRHPPCRCGCGELADECAGPRPALLGSMTVTTTDPNPYDPMVLL